MDAHRFDRMTKAVAAKVSRRDTLRATGAGLAAAALSAVGGRASAAQEATPATTEQDIPLLYVQVAQGGTWAPKEGEAGVYTLTLTGAAAQTVYFSDRPERVVGVLPMQDFLATLGFTPENPPNAALVAQTNQGEDVLVIELLSPVYDEAAGTLTYDARVLENYREEGLRFLADRQDDPTMPEQFGAASLFVDGPSCPDGYVYCNRDNRRVGQLTSGLCYTPIRCEVCNKDGAYWAGQCNANFPDCGGQCKADTSYCWSPLNRC